VDAIIAPMWFSNVYYLIKLAFTVWLFHPTTQGATIIYYAAIDPLWNTYHKRLEEMSTKFENTVK
jgi:hypothetical protein